MEYNQDIFCPVKLVDSLVDQINNFYKIGLYDQSKLNILKFDTNSYGEMRLNIRSNNWELLHLVIGFCKGYIVALYNR